MTTVTANPVKRVPQLTLGWRMKMALETSDLSAQDMADLLGVSRATVSRWMNGHGTAPRRGFVLVWAERTGVDEGWLLNGECVDTLPYPHILPTFACLLDGA